MLCSDADEASTTVTTRAEDGGLRTEPRLKSVRLLTAGSAAAAAAAA